MSQDDIQKAIKAQQPVEPVCIRLSNGATFDVRHPDAIMVGRTQSAILIDGSIHLIGNLHVNHIEPLAVTHE